MADGRERLHLDIGILAGHGVRPVLGRDGIERGGQDHRIDMSQVRLLDGGLHDGRGIVACCVGAEQGRPVLERQPGRQHRYAAQLSLNVGRVGYHERLDGALPAQVAQVAGDYCFLVRERKTGHCGFVNELSGAADREDFASSPGEQLLKERSRLAGLIVRDPQGSVQHAGQTGCLQQQAAR